MTGTDPNLPPAAAPSTSRPLLAYLLILLLLPLLAIPAAIALGRSDFFLRHGASIWVRANDAIFTMRGRRCDILLFGDSTALTGLDPGQIARETGLVTCNIAVTNAVLAVTGTLPLDRFLAHNSRPRILLLQFAPETFSEAARPWQQTIYAEGLLELLRHGDPRVARSTLLHHPREALRFAGYSAGFTAFALLKGTWAALTHTRSAEDRIVIRNGFFTPPAPARTTCALSEIASPDLVRDRPAAAARIAALQRRFGPAAGQLLITIAPIPACDPNLAALQTELHGLTADPLATLPISLFSDERHYTAAGAATLSHQTATTLAPRRDARNSLASR